MQADLEATVRVWNVDSGNVGVAIRGSGGGTRHLE